MFIKFTKTFLIEERHEILSFVFLDVFISNFYKQLHKNSNSSLSLILYKQFIIGLKTTGSASLLCNTFYLFTQLGKHTINEKCNKLWVKYVHSMHFQLQQMICDKVNHSKTQKKNIKLTGTLNYMPIYEGVLRKVIQNLVCIALGIYQNSCLLN